MIFDIHCHSSLKQFVFGDNITHHHPILFPDLLPFGMHADLHSLEKGGVKIIMCTHYLPEYEFRNATVLGIPARWLIDTFEALKKIAENRSTPDEPFNQTLRIIQNFENEIEEAREKKGFNVSIAKNMIELKQQLSRNSTVFLHSIEGAHSLGYKLSYDQIKNHLDKLIELGLCQFTIAHFFDNSIVPSQGGIPPSLRNDLKLNNAPDPNKGLTEIGEKVVEYLLDKGIIIDLVHCTPKARKDILDINNERTNPKPIVLSHTGLRSLASKGDIQKYPHDLEYLPSDEEVKEIIKTEGVIGVIFMNYWVNGTEEHNLLKHEIGIPDIIKTMQKIRDLEKEVDSKYDCDHISIGTDFDGFTEVPDDLVSAENMKDLITSLKNSDFNSEQIEKISWRNYMRVLERGWQV